MNNHKIRRVRIRRQNGLSSVIHRCGRCKNFCFNLSIDVINADEHGDAEGFADDFLDMMGGAVRNKITAFTIMWARGNVLNVKTTLSVKSFRVM